MQGPDQSLRPFDKSPTRSPDPLNLYVSSQGGDPPVKLCCFTSQLLPDRRYLAARPSFLIQLTDRDAYNFD